MRALRRGLCTWRPNQRPIILQRIEAAAREGDLEQVRAILREADRHERVHATSSFPRPRLLPAVLAYAAWNTAASAYDYRVVGRAAEAELVEASARGQDEVRVSLSLRSCSTRATLSTYTSGPRMDEDDAVSTEERRDTRVRTLPHIYLSDCIFGLSRWTLTCRKAHGRTEYFTGPAAGEGGDGGPASSFASSSWSWRSDSER
jgi:hypothetical protein